MAKTRIEWAEVVWNPITGCTPISEGCQNCYAKRMSKRIAGRCGYPADDPFRVTLHPDRLGEPLRWKKSRRVFVCSMGDLFHDDVPDEYVAKVWEVMNNANQHTFMVLTKRPKRMKEFLSRLGWYTHDRETNPAEAVLDEGGKYTLPNVWLGVTAENQKAADERIPILLQIPAAVRFVSIEPMLGPVVIPEEWPDWVICGGETGPGARPMHPDWVRSLRDQCQDAGVPFFFKSWGEWVPVYEGGVHLGDICMSKDGFVDTAGKDYVCFANESDGTHMRKVGKKKVGRMLDGRTWDEIPEL